VAQKVSVRLISDLSSHEADNTVRFGYEGYDYEIDLTEAEQETLGAFLSTYISAARRAGRSGARGAGRARPAALRTDTNAIREWAKENGLDVSERGRIPAAIVERYEAR
jgi:hypothetical protein